MQRVEDKMDTIEKLEEGKITCFLCQYLPAKYNRRLDFGIATITIKLCEVCIGLDKDSVVAALSR